MLLLVLLGSGLALAEDGERGSNEADSGQSDELTASPLPKGAEEVPAKRTATSQTFELPDGTRETRLFQAPVNYRDEAGKWQPIEEGLRGGDGSALRNGNNSFDLTLPANLGAAPVRFAREGAWVASRLLGAPSEPVDLEDGTATYQLANPETSVELSTLANGVKENIEIASPSAPSTFHFELTASAGLTPSTAKDGAIEFRDQDDDLVAQLPAPFMFDSSGTPDGFSNAVEYELKPNDSGAWLLTVAASKEWLDDPGRKWPVTIDPSIFGPHPPFFDCSVYSAPPIETLNSCGQKGAPLLGTEVYERASTPDEYSRTLAFFRLIGTSIPTTADVIGSEMHFYSPEAAQHTNGVELTRLTAAWSSYVSWKYSGYPNCFTCAPWATPGGTGSEVVAELTTAARGGSAAGWWHIPLQEKMVQDWVTVGEPANLGVAIKQLGEPKLGSCTPSCLYRKLNFQSSAASNPSQRPYLAITYIPPAPAAAKMVSPSEGTRTPKRLKLKAAWPGLNGVTGIKFQWREKATEGFQDIPVSLITTADGKALTGWNEAAIEPIGAQESKVYFFDAAHASANLASKGGALEVRAVLVPDETGIGGYTPPAHATVDRNLGSGKDATAPVGPGSVDLLTGNFSVTRTDVSIPGFNSTLEFARTINSRGPDPKWHEHQSKDPTKKELKAGVFGGNWEPTVPVEAAGGSVWQRLIDYNAAGEGPYVALTTPEGYEIPFEVVGGGYIAPPEMPGWQLTKVESNFVLADLDGNRTTFAPVTGSTTEFVPVSISTSGGSGNKTQMVWSFTGGGKRLSMVIAPAPPGITCSSANYTTKTGCKSLAFTYGLPAGVSAQLGERLLSITYYAPGFGGPWEVSRYEYNSNGNLIAQWDPRISPNLKESYAYTGGTEGKYGGQMQTLTPPGVKPWTMEYGSIEGETPVGALKAVKRDSLVEGSPVAQTTVAYGVPLSGTPAPNQMGPAEVKKWAQTDVPVDATAIFPPDQVPASPPTSYSRATVYYMDAEGYTVNTATPKGAGTAAPSISTSETDGYGNVVRELTPQNRLRALAKPTQPEQEATAKVLSTQRFYSTDGTEMQEEFGPQHSVRIQEGELAGQLKSARQHRTIVYDQLPSGVALPTPAPHLPTKVITGASIEGQANDADRRITETKYDWTLRKPTESIEDPEGLNLRTVTVYNPTSGLPVESRQPSEPGGGGAGTTKTTYWSNDNHDPCFNAIYAGLPCLIEPAAQPGTPGQPQVKVTKIAAYNALAQPTEVWEAPGKSALEAGTPRRTTVSTYDAVGRTQAVQRTGGGATVPKVKFEYSSSTGAPTAQRFDCATGGCEGSDDQAVTSVYDALGRVTEYTDADANTSKVTYDLLGRPVTTNDGKGTQTRTYDPTSGLLTKLEDSAAGTFTASYDADGNLVEEGLPNGLVAEQSYDEAGQLTDLTYGKAGSAWLDFDAERSINGQILWQESLTSRQQYSYDKAGRLVKTNDWDAAVGGNCTTREYVFGEPGYESLPGKNSNRTRMMTRPSGVAGACTTTGGSEQKYKYDGADRLIGEGVVYDDYGRITSLPAVFAGGKALTTSYFTTDMVASQTQNGVTNTFQVDASLRQRQRTQGGGLEGVEVFHYAGPSDTPAWTQLGAKWSRNISGIGGSLAAIQDSNSGTLLQLTNLHGDVVATATLSTSATEPVATFEYDEFGVPKQGSTLQFGWLGDKGRRTEFATGVIQMGKRSYVPALGRFLTPDPILGGSANPYEYANQDPINQFDLTGECAHPGKGKCAGPPTPKWAKEAARKANKRGAIVTKFKTRAGAERFARYLQSNPLYLENIQRKEAKWRAEDLKVMRERATRAASEEAQFADDNGGACKWISYGSGALGIALAPVSGGATAAFAVGIFGFSTGTGDVANLC